MRCRDLAAGVAALAFCGSALARPEGPITVTAEHADWNADGLMIYEGAVVMRSATLELRGQRVEVRRTAPDQYQARIEGTPAELTQTAEAPTPAVRASAERMFLDSQAGLVELDRRAQLARGGETLSGETIRYDFLGRRIRAGGGAQGPVRIDIQTESLKAVDLPK